MDRSWMSKPRSTTDYKEGVELMVGYLTYSNCHTKITSWSSLNVIGMMFITKLVL